MVLPVFNSATSAVCSMPNTSAATATSELSGPPQLPRPNPSGGFCPVGPCANAAPAGNAATRIASTPTIVSNFLLFIVLPPEQNVAGLFPFSAHSLAAAHGEFMEKPWGKVEDLPAGIL